MRALVALAIIGALLVGGDTLVRSVAEGRVEEQITRELGDDGDVEVALGGFPFTIRALNGRIPSATVTGSDIRRGPLTIDTFEMDVRGVEVSLGDSSARIEHGSGAAMIELGSLAAFIDRRTDLASVSFDNGELSARVPSIGRTFTAPVALETGRLVVEVPIAEPIGLRLPRLFRGLDYTSLEIAAAGATLRFELRDAVLR